MKVIDRVRGDAQARTLQYHLLVLVVSMITIVMLQRVRAFPCGVRSSYRIWTRSGVCSFERGTFWLCRSSL